MSSDELIDAAIGDSFDEEEDYEENGNTNGHNGFMDEEDDDDDDDRFQIPVRKNSNRLDEDEFDEEQVDEQDGKDLFEELKKMRFSSDNFFNLSEHNEAFQAQKAAAEDEEDQDDDVYITKKQVSQLEGLVDSEAVKRIEKEAPEFLVLANELKRNIQELKLKFLPISAFLKKKKLDLKSGMSYIDVKFSLLAFYSMNLAFYILLKVQGKPVKDHPVIRRMIYIKTLLSKLKPIDKKLDYQITKLLRLANQETLIGQKYVKSQNVDEDPLSLRPRPEAMSKVLTTDDLEITASGEVVEASAKRNVYRAPKLKATLMEDEIKANREKRKEEFRKKKLLKSEALRNLQEEFDDEPLEIKQNTNAFDEEIEDEEDKRRRRYEEENFVRLPMTKEYKKKLKEREKKAMQRNRIDDFSEMEQLREIFQEERQKKMEKASTNAEKLQKTLAEHLSKRRNPKNESGPRHEDEDFRELKKKKSENAKPTKKSKGDDLNEDMFFEEGDEDDFGDDKFGGGFGDDDDEEGGFTEKPGKKSFNKFNNKFGGKARDNSGDSKGNNKGFNKGFNKNTGGKGFKGGPGKKFKGKGF